MSADAQEERALQEDLHKFNQERIAIETRLRDLSSTSSGQPRAGETGRSTQRLRSSREDGARLPPSASERPPKRRRLDEPPEPSRPGPQRAYENDTVKARSRRMFGALMGHLGSAKSTLEKDATVAKQQSKQREATLKLEAERRSIREAHSLERRAAHGREVDRRDQVITSLRLTEQRLLHVTWSKSRALLANFIRTKATPSLCWLPKQHTELTETLLAQNAESVAAELACRAALRDERARELEADLDDRKQKRKRAAEHTSTKLAAIAERHHAIEKQPSEPPQGARIAPVPNIDDEDDDDDDSRNNHEKAVVVVEEAEHSDNAADDHPVDYDEP